MENILAIILYTVVQQMFALVSSCKLIQKLYLYSLYSIRTTELFIYIKSRCYHMKILEAGIEIGYIYSFCIKLIAPNILILHLFVFCFFSIHVWQFGAENWSILVIHKVGIIGLFKEKENTILSSVESRVLLEGTSEGADKIIL